MIEIKAGPELDLAVLCALGAVYRKNWKDDDGCHKMSGWYYQDGSVACREEIPRFSRDLNAVFAAAEIAASSEYGEWSLSTYVGSDERGWTCSLRDDAERVFAPTPALAICAAILKLKG